MIDSLLAEVKREPRRVTTALRRLTTKLEAIAARPEESVELEAKRMQVELREAINEFYAEVERCGRRDRAWQAGYRAGGLGDAGGVRPYARATGEPPSVG